VLLRTALTVTLTAIGGDLLSQSIEGSYSALRTLRFTIFRVCCTMPIYGAWVALAEKLNRLVPRQGRPVAKTLAECVIYTPLYHIFFFCAMGLSEGRPMADSLGRCIHMLPTTLPASWKFWIPIQLFTYSACPLQWRVAWVNVVSLIWNAIMSSFNAASA